jgi:hypothetical protein
MHDDDLQHESRHDRFRRTRAVANRVDPVHLIAIGAPDDEYDAEVHDLVRLAEPVSADDVAAVFAAWFHPGIVSEADAAAIAAGLARP